MSPNTVRDVSGPYSSATSVARWEGSAAPRQPFDTWNAQYPALVSAQQRAEGVRQAKDEARAEFEREIRPVTNFVQSYPKTTDADDAPAGERGSRSTADARTAPGR